MPCQFRSKSKHLKTCVDGEWTKQSPCIRNANGIMSCCGDHASCLKEHLVSDHFAEVAEACDTDVFGEKAYHVYLEAIGLKEQESIPTLGYSIDRRTFQHLKTDLNEDASRALICMLCAQIRCTSNTHNSDIGRTSCCLLYTSPSPRDRG